MTPWSSGSPAAKLLGPDVNAVHRLLKNHVHDLVGLKPYALITDAALGALDIPADGIAPITETYDEMPAIPAPVLLLA